MNPFPALPRRAAIMAFSGGALALLVAAAPWSASTQTNDLGAHVVGNPAAKIKLVEYFSYTCGACGHFAQESAAPLKSQYVDKGLVQVEYRNLVRDPVDATAALLARCGGKAKFVGNHNAIFAKQADWLGRVQGASEAQMKSWNEGRIEERTRKIAKDVGLITLMQARGYTPAQLNVCLGDAAALSSLVEMTKAGQKQGVRGTPSFFINGKQAEGHQWPAIKTSLDLALKGA
ncbi:DsbA family protein [Sphingopyxis sp. MWB1]|uniref:DsbA family protein n=1 Tax=Sphingopyxis sp. MWB1 TaxID=1537715 RepID=UPI00051A02BE|nr:thioredoxin domain-containing protein [Sphingopyxis sp. MWB1]